MRSKVAVAGSGLFHDADGIPEIIHDETISTCAGFLLLPQRYARAFSG